MILESLRQQVRRRMCRGVQGGAARVNFLRRRVRRRVWKAVQGDNLLTVLHVLQIHLELLHLDAIHVVSYIQYHEFSAIQ